MKKAAIYARVSTPDQHLENQILDLRKMAAQRNFEVVHEYCDRGISGTKAKRPGLDAMMADARRGEFSVVFVAAFDRIARSTKNFLEIVDELNELGIEFVSAREAVDTTGAMGKLFVTLIAYYLTYHRYATRKQVESCYPKFAEFLRLKKKYDPEERFQSDWYRHYKAVFADSL